MQAIQRRHCNSSAQKVGFAQKVGCALTAEPIIEGILARTLAVIAQVRPDLPRAFSPRLLMPFGRAWAGCGCA